MEALECSACGYKFKSPKKPNRCPYCSKEGSVHPVKTAQDYLDESF